MSKKEILLKLLDDPDIAKKIREISNNGEPDDVKDIQSHTFFESKKYSEADLKERIEQCKKDCEDDFARRLAKVNNENQIELSNVQMKLESAMQSVHDLTEEKKQIENKYGIAEKLHSIYSKFTAGQITWFNRVLHDDNSRTDSPLKLIVWATQKENLVAFWELVTSHLSEIIENNQVEIFYTFFVDCFNLYSATTRGKSVLFLPETGDEYDPLKYSKTSDSKSSGVITRVIFPGYCIGNDNKKPIVKVG